MTKYQRMKCALTVTICLLGLPNITKAQGRLPADLGTNGGLKVECWTGTAFGACSSGGAGTDVNIAAVGGTPTGGPNVPVTCISGCAGGTSDTDDGSIAAGQTTSIPAAMMQIFDGTVWRRLRWGQAVMASSVPITIASDQTSIPTTETSPSTIFNGVTNVTTAGTRVTLAASTTVKGVTICAKTTNTGNIFIGNATVSSSNGRIIRPGECQSISIANLNTVNLDSAVNGEGVTYIGVN